MLESAVLLAALALPQTDAPQSRPRSQPDSQPDSQPSRRPSTDVFKGRKQPDDDRRRARAEWGSDAPGREVMHFKMLPIKNAPYTTSDKVAKRVRDVDLVIGLVVKGKAFAYPINMLGGPHREIINEEYGGVPFCVNW